MDQSYEYEPVQQLYQVRESKDGAASKWQVDTSNIRRFLEEKLKGMSQVEVEYNIYKLLINGEDQDQVFMAEDDKHAQKMLHKYADIHDIDRRRLSAKDTSKTETKLEMRRVKEPLLPDEVIDHILTPIESTFSQVGYLTKYNERDIKDELYRNVSTIRTKLFEAYHERDDMDPSNFELVVNMVWNIVKQVLKAAEGGWTGQRLSETTQERVVTRTGDTDKKIMSLGG